MGASSTIKSCCIETNILVLSNEEIIKRDERVKYWAKYCMHVHIYVCVCVCYLLDIRFAINEEPSCKGVSMIIGQL